MAYLPSSTWLLDAFLSPGKKPYHHRSSPVTHILQERTSNAVKKLPINQEGNSKQNDWVSVATSSLYPVSFSVNRGQPQSENMRWKISETANLCFQSYVVLRGAVKLLQPLHCILPSMGITPLPPESILCMLPSCQLLSGQLGHQIIVD